MLEVARTTCRDLSAVRKDVSRELGGQVIVFIRFFLVAAAYLLLLTATAGMAESQGDEVDHDLLTAVFPDADRLGPVEGEPPARPAYRGESLVGYVFSTRQVVASKGFSGKDLDILAGVGLDGVLTGAAILEHKEPILIIGVADKDLSDFVAQYRGLDIRQPVRVERRRGKAPGRVDAVSGATISSVVMNDAILRAARAVARSRGILGDAQARLDFESFEPVTWRTLVEEGSLVEFRLSVGEIEAALSTRGGWLAPKGVARDPDAEFLTLAAGLATPARVGRNLLGDQLYNRVMAGLSAGDQVVFVAGRGLYSFKGTGYIRSGIFDRLQLVQGERTIRLRKDDHVRVDELNLDAGQELRELALFILRASDEFSPSRPWRLEILVEGEDDAGAPVLASFVRSYELPGLYVRAQSAPPVVVPPLWQQTWSDRKLEIAVLVVALFALSAILVFQDSVARRKRLYLSLRIGFLLFILVWLGWYAGAQLSVLNVLTFIQAVLTGFHWDFFLLDPLMFILWGYVAVALLFWGRGVFCGWLCPFGALQELTNRLAQWAGLRQLRLPFGLHERLWPIKYMLFLGIFALSLHDMALAFPVIEAEPFKTAIVLRFERAWPFVLYVLVLLGVGLFVSRAYCRYLCPLGAALAIPARLRMFEWLKRRWQCGTPCQQCAQACPVQAIHPDGRINPNECVHCLNCQVNYYDDALCPPLIERRKRREARRTKQPAAEAAGGVTDGGAR
jgi:transcriptional regulator of nitric oxide reductase/ferredoxin